MEERDTSGDDLTAAPTRTRAMGPQQPPAGPKKKLFTLKGCGCLGGVVLLVIIIAAIADSAGKSSTTPTAATSAGPSWPSPYSTDGINWASPTDDSYTDIPIDPPPTDDPSTAAVAEKVTYHCSGHAPDGIDITYGPSGSQFSASHLPFTKSATLDDSAQYYAVQGQLSGGGSVMCSLTVQTSDGTVVTQSGSASGGYNIASAEICGSFDGSWEKC